MNLQVLVSIKNLERLLVMDKSHIENHVRDLNMKILIENKGERAKGLNKEYLQKKRRLIFSDKLRKELDRSPKLFKETF